MSEKKNENKNAPTDKPLLSDVCHWDDEDNSAYDTECGNNFYLNDGDIYKNQFKYCPFCGKEITIKFIGEYGELK